MLERHNPAVPLWHHWSRVGTSRMVCRSLADRLPPLVGRQRLDRPHGRATTCKLIAPGAVCWPDRGIRGWSGARRFSYSAPVVDQQVGRTPFDSNVALGPRNSNHGNSRQGRAGRRRALCCLQHHVPDAGRQDGSHPQLRGTTRNRSAPRRADRHRLRSPAPDDSQISRTVVRRPVSSMALVGRGPRVSARHPLRDHSPSRGLAPAILAKAARVETATIPVDCPSSRC